MNESGKSTAKRDRTRCNICIASRECPPRAKKSCSMPTSTPPNKTLQISAIARSVGFAGVAAAWASGETLMARTAVRSTLPAEVSGMRSNKTYAEGVSAAGSIFLM